MIEILVLRQSYEIFSLSLSLKTSLSGLYITSPSMRLIDPIYIYLWSVSYKPIIVCSKIFIQHISTSFNTRERRAMKIDERKKFHKKIFSLTSFFTRKKNPTTIENRFLSEIYNGECFQNVNREYLGTEYKYMQVT